MPETVNEILGQVLGFVQASGLMDYVVAGLIISMVLMVVSYIMGRGR